MLNSRQTDEDYFEIQGYRERIPDSENSGDAPQSEESTENRILDENMESINTDNTGVSEHDGTMEKVDTEDKNRRGLTATASQKHYHSKREKRPPKYLQDYLTYSKDDVTNVSVDYCYRAVCGVPHVT